MIWRWLIILHFLDEEQCRIVEKKCLIFKYKSEKNNSDKDKLPYADG